MQAKNAKKDGKAIINQDASLNDASTDDDQQLPPIEIKRAPKVEETNVENTEPSESQKLKNPEKPIEKETKKK